MVKIYKYGNNLILDEGSYSHDSYLIDIKKLTEVMNYYLIGQKELKESDISTNRIGRNENYIIIAPYGSLNGETLFNFVVSYLECSNLKYKDLRYFGCPESALILLKSFIPRVSERRNSQCGGGLVDSIDIELGIEPLCKAINSFSGINTFSSCEGHPSANSCTLYTLFTALSLECLNPLSRSFDKNLEILYKEHDFKKMVEDVSLLFDYGHWPDIQKTYFEFRIRYYTVYQAEVFERIKLLSKLMEDDLK